MNKKISFLLMLEGVVKLNIAFLFIIFLLMLIKDISTEKLLFLCEQQTLLILLSIFFGKVYQKTQGYKFRTQDIKMSSLLIGYTIYFCIYLISSLFFKEYNSKNTFLGLVAGYAYWFGVTWLARNSFLDGFIRFLHGTIGYKSFFQLFWMFNIAFFVLIFVMISVGMLAGKSLFGSIFAILYFEIAFIVFHVFLAKIFDYFWSHQTYDQKKVSIMGLYFASILYVAKLSIINESFFGVMRIESTKAVLSVVALISFWTFFCLLFRFDTGAGK